MVADDDAARDVQPNECDEPDDDVSIVYESGDDDVVKP
jgi:hypothetical protein